MDALEEWTGQAVAVLGVDPGLLTATQDEVLDMVREVAHGVLRPAAPVTAYLVGLAAGRAAAQGEDAAAAVRAALAQVEELVSEWGRRGLG